MANQSKYKRSIVTLIDVLGFAELVDQGMDPDQIHSTLSRFRRFSDPADLGGLSYEQNFTSFSDTVVRSTPLESASNLQYQVGILFHELQDLIFIQANLINIGVFVRGGVFVGDIFHDINYVFGPALNAAARLEKSIAVYPRIIIDPSVLSLAEQEPLLKATHHDYSTESTYIKYNIKQSDDGVWFIDYLCACRNDFEDPFEYGEYLKKHKTVLLNQAQNQNALTAKSVKHSWVAHYHNQTIDSLSDEAFSLFGLPKDALMITRRDISKIYYQF